MWYACGIALGFPDEGELALPISLTAGIRIERIPDWVKTDEALDLLSWTERDAVQDSLIRFALEYDAEALGSPDPVALWEMMLSRAALRSDTNSSDFGSTSHR